MKQFFVALSLNSVWPSAKSLLIISAAIFRLFWIKIQYKCIILCIFSRITIWLIRWRLKQARKYVLNNIFLQLQSFFVSYRLYVASCEWFTNLQHLKAFKKWIIYLEEAGTVDEAMFESTCPVGVASPLKAGLSWPSALQSILQRVERRTFGVIRLFLWKYSFSSGKQMSSSRS